MPWPWLRLYSEARNDPKLEALSDQEFRVWFRLLCLASDQETRGAIYADPNDTRAMFTLALNAARGDLELLATTIRRLIAMAILEPILDDADPSAIRGWTFAAWQRRQYPYPSDHPTARTARVHRHRARRGADPPAGVTSETSSNEYVTSSNEVKRGETKRNDTDIDVDTDSELDPDNYSRVKENGDYTDQDQAGRQRVAQASDQGRQRAAQASVPDQFPLFPQHEQWWHATLDGFDPPAPDEWRTRAWLSASRDRFLSYHRDHGSTSADWNAAWETWMQREIYFWRRDLAKNGAATQGGSHGKTGSRSSSKKAGAASTIAQLRGRAIPEDDSGDDHHP